MTVDTGWGKNISEFPRSMTVSSIIVFESAGMSACRRGATVGYELHALEAVCWTFCPRWKLMQIHALAVGTWVGISGVPSFYGRRKEAFFE